MFIFRTLWTNTGLFNPGRFVHDNCPINNDLTAKVMIFGLGKRRYLGYSFSHIEIFTLTVLLHWLNINSGQGQNLAFSSDFGLAIKLNQFKFQSHWEHKFQYIFGPIFYTGTCIFANLWLCEKQEAFNLYIKWPLFFWAKLFSCTSSLVL